MGGRGASINSGGGRLAELKKISGGEYSKTVNGEQIDFYTSDRQESQRIENEILNSKRATPKEITQEVLNNAPVYLVSIYGENRSYKVVKDIATLEKIIKNEYGGYRQLGGKLNQDYFIKSAVGDGKDYFLERDKFSKNGRKWVDDGGREVKGRVWRKMKGVE